MRPLRPPRPRAAARGFTLVEVLIVVLVMAFGLLGIAALQANTARFKMNAWMRSAASVQFADLADRIRANPAQAGGALVASDGSTTDPAPLYVFTQTWTQQQPDPPAAVRDCLGAVCTPVQRAEYDLAVWRGEVRRQFPQGSVHLEGSVGAQGVRATLAWFDRAFVDGDGNLRSAPVCTAASPAAEAANCCPAALAAPAGVRCARLAIVP